jgi:hypothetical protein
MRASVVFALALLPLAACMEQNFQSQVPDAEPGENATVPVPNPADPIIRIDPEEHDFGAPFLGCELSHTYRIHNDGDADLVIDDMAFDADSADLAFDNQNGLPITVLPHGGVDVTVSYLPFDTQDDAGELTVSSNDPATPLATATALGAGKSAGKIHDIFDEPVQPMSDILVVVDNSGSMAEEQNNLTNNFQTFIDAVVAADADWRVAVITTDSPNFRGPVITAATGNPVGAFSGQASVGTNGSANEKPMQMIAESLDAGGDAAPGGVFFRDDALLAIIVVTDEPDQFSSMTPAALTTFLVGLKNGDASKVVLHTIGGDVPQPACNSAAAASVPLDQAVALTGGQFESVCNNWGNSLSSVAAGSVTLADSFALSQEPLEGSITITVDGDDVTSGWTYDPATNEIVFDADAVPENGAEVKVNYEPVSECD